MAEGRGRGLVDIKRHQVRILIQKYYILKLKTRNNLFIFFFVFYFTEFITQD